VPDFVKTQLFLATRACKMMPPHYAVHVWIDAFIFNWKWLVSLTNLLRFISLTSLVRWGFLFKSSLVQAERKAAKKRVRSAFYSTFDV
jgi:hypothetical protein